MEERPITDQQLMVTYRSEAWRDTGGSGLSRVLLGHCPGRRRSARDGGLDE